MLDFFISSIVRILIGSFPLTVVLPLSRVNNRLSDMADNNEQRDPANTQNRTAHLHL